MCNYSKFTIGDTTFYGDATGPLAVANNVVVPLTWLATYGLAANEAVLRSANPRLTIADCYLAGIDPRDASADFGIVDILRREDSVSVLTLPAIPNGKVSVKGRTSLGDSAEEMSFSLNGRSISVPDAENSPSSMFYQVYVTQ